MLMMQWNCCTRFHAEKDSARLQDRVSGKWSRSLQPKAGRCTVHAGYRNGKQRTWIFPVCFQGIACTTGWLCHDKQRSQHDEAWLIFMDMVNNQILPLKRKPKRFIISDVPYLVWTCRFLQASMEWCGAWRQCSNSWACKGSEHVDNYVTIFNAVTGSNVTKQIWSHSQKESTISSGYSTSVAGLAHGSMMRSISCLRTGYKGRIRIKGGSYDKQLKEQVNFDPEGNPPRKKMKPYAVTVKTGTNNCWMQFTNAVLDQKWCSDNRPPEKLGMDLPELLEVIKPFQLKIWKFENWDPPKSLFNRKGAKR